METRHRENNDTFNSNSNIILKLTGKQCTVDSGGYTMKWRRVNPNPWGVRCKSTVLGLGHANSSSVVYGPAVEPAKFPHSGDSFYTKRKEDRATEGSPTFTFILGSTLVTKSMSKINPCIQKSPFYLFTLQYYVRYYDQTWKMSF